MINYRTRLPVLAAAVALVLVASGCGDVVSSSGDSSSGDGGETTSAMPEIADPAVEAAALRAVDACALLDAKNLTDVGTVVPDSVSETGWGECSVDVDAGGKTLELVLTIGDQLILLDDVSGELEGLPLIVDDEDPASCWISVVTSYELELGITVHAELPGGDGCELGRTALGQLVRTLRAEPPQHEQLPGSVLTADPCALAAEDAVRGALGDEIFVEVASLHDCNFWTGDGTTYPLVSVRVYEATQPDASEGEPVDLGGGVTAIQLVTDEQSTVSCNVTWRVIATPTDYETDDHGELISVSLDGEPEDGLDVATACEKAVPVAKAVAAAVGKA
jgi:hypothetical protein